MPPPAPLRRSFILAAERVSEFAEQFTAGIESEAPAVDTPIAQNSRVSAVMSDAKALSHDAFAPLLSRLATTRLLNGARALLRSLGTFLDCPARMRIAVQERRWVDAVKHYRRAHALPPSYRSIELLQNAQASGGGACASPS